MGRGRKCNLSLLVGEDTVAKGNGEERQKLIVRARKVCHVHTVQYLVAGVELKSMKK
jgi:hypothetical protein